MLLDMAASVELLDISTHEEPEKTLELSRTYVKGLGLDLEFSGIANFNVDLKQIDQKDRRPVLQIGFYLDSPDQLLSYTPQLLEIIREQWRIAQEQRETCEVPEVPLTSSEKSLEDPGLK
jgi:hypothetical protein